MYSSRGCLIKIKTPANISHRSVGGDDGNRYNRLLLLFFFNLVYRVGATRFIEMTKNIIVSSSLTINGPPPPRTPTAATILSVCPTTTMTMTMTTTMMINVLLTKNLETSLRVYIIY